MEFNDKKAQALVLMKNKKMLKLNYEPPMSLILWKLGYRVPPFHFAPFWQTVIILGSYFGIIFGLFMWFLQWRMLHISPSIAVIMSFLSGLMFGIIMALYYRWSKKVNKLPDWNDLN